MSDAHWIEVEDDLKTAAYHFEKAVRLFEHDEFDTEGIDGYAATMAFLHAMQLGHTYFENGLKRMLLISGEEPPTGDPFGEDKSWHEYLITQASIEISGHRPAILDTQMVTYTHDTRRFMSLATRGNRAFTPQETRKAVAAAKAITERIPTALNAFKFSIDRSRE